MNNKTKKMDLPERYAYLNETLKDSQVLVFHLYKEKEKLLTIKPPRYEAAILVLDEEITLTIDATKEEFEHELYDDETKDADQVRQALDYQLSEQVYNECKATRTFEKGLHFRTQEFEKTLENHNNKAPDKTVRNKSQDIDMEKE
ncbi:hypothetical protein KXD93_25515 [Mucilaginibacter sp. BJC16-A38]|uniref:hypothetical protein n=1 Tax=Mucilaginibacter phenanthrenivorans TaxID=1234842 RepID=UPI002157F364|nr:hypothetical protein [Mucilaginibacter phenanthrenivorans]MCR8561041.1 hypothetical protein [Mucilaginibacter phenanthrenivorans]